MTTAADEIELLVLPAEFEGLPHDQRLAAFAQAEAQLAGDIPVVTKQFGSAVAEQLVVDAAAHYLATTVMPMAESATPPSPRRGYQVGEPGNRGRWAGSPYGDAVARILDSIKGGTRRCGRLPPPV